LQQHFTPAPADLSDTAAMAGVTPLDIYRKISLGVPGTKMPSFGEALSREERWDLVAYVLTFTDPAARNGRTGQVAVVFGTVRGSLATALDLASRGNFDAAATKELDAYMAFETVEASLNATDPTIVKSVEERFTNMRGRLTAHAPLLICERARNQLLESLGQAERALAVHHSGAALFTESLLLMLREGFEAMLVVGAIMAVLVKAEARERQKNVRWGVVAAVAASLVTAAILEVILRVTAAEREALEGGLMLVAAAVLFYVSYWLISKVEIAAWTRFVKGQIQRAVESGSGMALAGVAFLAVYREGFETVLFYKALYVTGGADGTGPITAGIFAGLAALAAVYIGIERFGLKIPMRPFFAVTGATLSLMAFIFAGDGIKELQEGGYIGSTVLGWAPRSDFFGIYPTVESSGLQVIILAALIFALIWTFVVRPRRLAAAAPAQRSPRNTAPRRSPGS
jgi:high-affinity iron transporter